MSLDKIQMKIFWKESTILDPIKNIHNSWDKVKTLTLTGVWKKLIPTLKDDLEELKTAVKEVTVDLREIARERELELEPKHVNELQQSHDKSWTDEELLLRDQQSKSFLEMESTLGEDAVKMVKMKTKDLEYYLNLVDKAVAGFERTDSSFETFYCGLLLFSR